MKTNSFRGIVEGIVRDWLSEGCITLACGDWSSGAIMELVPEQAPMLTKERYDEPFAGLRDVRLRGEKHHIHLDLGKIKRVLYTVTPSVCYGYRPSFEIQFSSAAQCVPAFAVMIREPYRGSSVNHDALVVYFRHMLRHLVAFPDVVGVRVEVNVEQDGPTWTEVQACMAVAVGDGLAPPSLPREIVGRRAHEVAHA